LPIGIAFGASRPQRVPGSDREFDPDVQMALRLSESARRPDITDAEVEQALVIMEADLDASLVELRDPSRPPAFVRALTRFMLTVMPKSAAASCRDCLVGLTGLMDWRPLELRKGALLEAPIVVVRASDTRYMRMVVAPFEGEGEAATEYFRWGLTTHGPVTSHTVPGGHTTILKDEAGVHALADLFQSL